MYARLKTLLSVRLSRLTALLALALFLGCSATEAPPRGQLMVALATDMSIPKDVTHIRIKVKLGGEVRYEYDYQLAPDGEFHIPGTLAVVEGSTPNPVVGVEVIGIRTLSTGTTKARTFSKVVTTIPRERIALLRVPVQWLCDGTALDDGTGEYLSSCALVAGEEAACVAGTCQPVAVDASKLPTYDPASVFGGGATPTDPVARCFDTLKCFDSGYDLAPSVLAGDCTFTVPDDGSALNIALSMAPGGDGICHGAEANPPCYVPLDQDDTWGWHVIPGGVAGMRTVQLPAAVCNAVSVKHAQAVRVTTSCETKTSEFPTCGPWSSVTQGGEGGSGAATAGATGSGGMGGTMGNGGMGGAMGSSAIGAGGFGGSAGSGGTNHGGAGGQGGLASATGPGAGGTIGAGGAAAGGGGAGSGTGPEPCPGDVTFTDPNLEAVVRSALGKPTGAITGAEAAGLTTLTAGAQGITALSGIECLTGLISLTIINDQITDTTPLAKLTNLRELSLGTNQIADITPLKNLTNLTNLDVDNNQIADIGPLANLTHLVFLTVDNNQISDISVLASLKDLMFLYADYNQISDVSALSGLTKLTSLDLGTNLISSIGPLVDLTNLTLLNVISNRITETDTLAHMSNLTSLFLAGNAIESLSGLVGLPNITELDLEDNQITDVTPLTSMTQMTTLLLDNNQITDISPLAKMTELTDLDMRFNAVVSLGALTDLTKLTNLYLEMNAASDYSALAGLTNLTTLSLDAISDLSPLVANMGLGAGDTITFVGNGYCNNTQIATLEDRGVNAIYGNNC